MTGLKVHWRSVLSEAALRLNALTVLSHSQQSARVCPSGAGAGAGGEAAMTPCATSYSCLSKPDEGFGQEKTRIFQKFLFKILNLKSAKKNKFCRIRNLHMSPYIHVCILLQLYGIFNFCIYPEKNAFYSWELFGKISEHTSAINPFLNSK